MVAKLDAEQLDAAASGAVAAAAAARNRVASARVALAVAEDNFARVAAAYPAGGISQAEYERALLSRDGARAELAAALSLAAQAEAGSAQREAQRREVSIAAPLSGVVLSRNLEPGEVASPGVPVVTIADLSALELYVYIPEDKIGLVNAGDAVTITVDSFREEKFAGRVKDVAARAAFTPRNIESREDRATLVFKVTVYVPNDHGRLKPGMPADVVFINTAAAGARKR